MAENPYVNKVELADGTTIMDITDTTATAEDVDAGAVFYTASGTRSTGTAANVKTITMNGTTLTPTSGDVDLGTVITSHQDISGKADKVSGATSGNFAALDSNGNLTDSRYKPSHFLTQHRKIKLGDAYGINEYDLGNNDRLYISSDPYDFTIVDVDDTGSPWIKSKIRLNTGLLLGVQEYSSSSAYNVGDKCSYDSVAYVCTTAIPSPGESWNNNHWEVYKFNNKADKVLSATSGNFASLDSNGNLTDSGHKHSDYLTSHQDITGKADKVTSATSGNFASLDSNGNLVDSGHKHSDYATTASTLREVPFSIATTDWTSGNDGYTATVTTAYVTSSSKDFVQFDRSIRLAHDDITTAKVLNGGGIVFTTGSIPAGTITGNIYTIGDEDGKTTVLVENAFIIKPFEVELDAISDASGAYSHTTTDSRVTEAMKPISIEYGNPAAFLSPVTVATGNGTITLSCSNVVGSSTVKVTVLPTQSIDWAQSAPTTITSAEADILADRIDSTQLVYRGTDISSSNLNSITTPGRYYAGDASTLTNAPSGITSSNSADLIVMERAVTTRVWQVLFIYSSSSPSVWIRVMTGASTWSTWSKLSA